MKKFFAGLSLVILTAGAQAQTTVVNCIDGSRSMTVSQINDTMSGRLNDFRMKLDHMKCGVLPNANTIRCDQGDYYVLIFQGSQTQKLNVQVNVKGDFYPDSGYLHSLNCR